MGIKRLLIDSRIQGVWAVWYGHTKTCLDRHLDKEEAAAQQHVQWFNDCCGSQRVGWSLQ